MFWDNISLKMFVSKRKNNAFLPVGITCQVKMMKNWWVNVTNKCLWKNHLEYLSHLKHDIPLIKSKARLSSRVRKKEFCVTLKLQAQNITPEWVPSVISGFWCDAFYSSKHLSVNIKSSCITWGPTRINKVPFFFWLRDIESHPTCAGSWRAPTAGDKEGGEVEELEKTVTEVKSDEGEKNKIMIRCLFGWR